MFPKSYMDEPFPYTSSQEFPKRPFAYDHHNHHHNQNPNPTSTVIEDHPFFLNFPSPFLDVHGFPLSQIFSQRHHQEPDSNNHHGDESELGKAKDNPSAADISRIGRARLKKIMEDQGSSKKISAEGEATSSRKGKVSTKPRRRTGKKDRHSKICTAQGVRDRRMRLSLQIARKFFDLQDMLGFDKASKTIEWLFSKSKNAIKELSAQNNSNDNNNNNSNNNSNEMSECDNEIEEENNDFVEPEKEHTRKLSKMESSRDRAGTRAKAREKTKEKMAIKRANKGKALYETINPNNNTTQEIRRYTQFGFMESYLGGTSSSVTSIFDYNGGGGHNNIVDSDNCFMEFLENWDTIKSTNSNSNNRSTMITDEVQNIIPPGNSSSIYLDNPSS